MQVLTIKKKMKKKKIKKIKKNLKMKLKKKQQYHRRRCQRLRKENAVGWRRLPRPGAGQAVEPVAWPVAPGQLPGAGRY